MAFAYQVYFFLPAEKFAYVMAGAPGESAEDHPELHRLLELAADVVTSGSTSSDPIDPELAEMLRAAGYLD